MNAKIARDRQCLMRYEKGAKYMRNIEHKDYFCSRYGFKGDEDKAAFVLDSYAHNTTDLSDINRVLELYHAKLFFERFPEMPEWPEEKSEYYKNLSSGVMTEVRTYFDRINENNIVDIYNDCYVAFWDDFWLFIYRYKIYERISKVNFKDTIKSMRVNPYRILEDKCFVNFFDQELAELLEEPEYGARLLIDYYLERHNKPLDIYLPKSLTPEKKYKIINDYIDGENPNGNALNLIMNGKSAKEFPLDDKIRYKAKKRFERIWDDPSKCITTLQYGVGVSFGKGLPEKSIRFDKDNVYAEYGLDWIRENTDYPTLLNNFIYLFEYTDLQMRCSFTSISSMRSAIEDSFMVDGKTMYKCGQIFVQLNGLANAQMKGYKNVLEQEGIYLEEIVKWFFEDYLKSEFGVSDFVCMMPKSTDSILSRYERVASVMDGITKQFKMFCEDGEIDRGLYEMSSGSIKFGTIPSLINNKYAYCNCDKLRDELHAVFSDQSLLAYIEKTKGKYKSLYELICNESVSLSDFNAFQKNNIEWLIERGTIYCEEDSLLFNPERLAVLYELYHKEVICLQYHKSDMLKEMINNGEVIVESTLLSRLESQYFDYCLNKAEFTNGLDLRNKYIHDTATTDEERHKDDYIILLKLMIILVIKINEEFCLRDGE